MRRMTPETEIQEFRHGQKNMSTPSADQPVTQLNSLDSLVHNFDLDLEAFSRTIQSITEQVEALKTSVAYGVTTGTHDNHETLREELDDLQSDWADLVEADVRLRDELKEDQWLVVFRQ